MFIGCRKGLVCGEEFSGAACPIPAGHDKTDRKKEVNHFMCYTVKRSTKHIFTWSYYRIKNSLLEIIQKYPVLNAVRYPNYEQH